MGLRPPLVGLSHESCYTSNNHTKGNSNDNNGGNNDSNTYNNGHNNGHTMDIRQIASENTRGALPPLARTLIEKQISS